ncbi:MAG TPA: hypothetical protein VIN71_07510, partial [Pseudomonadales bacterium]
MRSIYTGPLCKGGGEHSERGIFYGTGWVSNSLHLFTSCGGGPVALMHKQSGTPCSMPSHECRYKNTVTPEAEGYPGSIGFQHRAAYGYPPPAGGGHTSLMHKEVCTSRLRVNACQGGPKSAVTPEAEGYPGSSSFQHCVAYGYPPP